MNDVFIGCYSRPLDGMRLCIPAEWARVFRGMGGVAAVELSGGRMVLTTKEIAEKLAEVIIGRLEHNEKGEKMIIKLPTGFVEGKSIRRR